MRKRVWFASTALLILSGCDGSGETVIGSRVAKEETRLIPPFTNLDISAMFEATVSVGPDCSLTLTVDDNLLPLVQTKVVEGRLEIQFAEGMIIVTNSPQKVAIIAPGLKKIAAHGAAKVLADPVATDSFSVESEGASWVELNGLDVQSLEVKQTGAGRVTINGKGKALTLDTSDTSKLNALDALFDSVEVAISGSSRCEVYVTTSIEGEVTGNSSLDIVGNPAQRSVKATGAARISY
jgi:hypothetical protein